jgi:hypothetical protein
MAVTLLGKWYKPFVQMGGKSNIFLLIAQEGGPINLGDVILRLD